jgi:preprotein translocase subunit SecD
VDTETRTFVYRVVPPDGAADGDLPGEVAAVLSARLSALRSALKLGRSSVRPLPPDRVELRLRHRDDFTQALSWLTMPGRVEFHLLHPDPHILESTPPDELPPGYELKVYRERRYILNRLGDLKIVEHQYAVEEEPILKIGRLAGADLETVGRKKAIVLTFTFGPEDAAAFGAVTALNAGRQMAMLVDGEMFFPPKEIESAVTDGRVQVQGYFLARPLRNLISVLQSGPLPARLELVGPSAGSPGS